MILVLLPLTLLSVASTENPLSGKVALICDASGGVGAELARRLGSQGVRLMLVTRTGRSESLTNRQSVYNKEGKSRSPQSQSQISAYTWNKLQQVRQEALASGSPQVELLSFDYGEVEHVHEILDKTIELLGRLDFLVLNQDEIARGSLLRAVHGQTPKFVNRTFSVNVFSPIVLALKALPHLQLTKGHIFVASSPLAEVPQGNLAVLASTKHALNGFFYSLQQELQQGKHPVTLTVGTLGDFGDKMPLFNLPSWMEGNIKECSKDIVQSFVSRPPTLACPKLHPILARFIWNFGWA